MLGTFEVTWSTQFEVLFGNLEAIGGIDHHLDALTGGLANLELGDQDAVALVGTTSHPTTQLVQLAESEAFGILDDHHRGIGHVHTHLDDGGGNEDMGFVISKALHRLILVC